MQEGKAQRLNVEDLDLICDALECQPGDLLVKSQRTKTTRKR
jgi:DNA-binding Xre family transcriptional regulator